MSDTGNTIGNVNVKVNATGVEEANRKIDSVVTHAKQAAASVSGIGGFSAGPGMTMGSVIGLGGSGGGGGGGAGGGVAASAAAAATQTKLLGSSLTSVLSRLVGIGAVSTVFHKLAEGALAFANASADMSDRMRAVNERFKIQTTYGESNYEKLTKASQDFHKKERQEIDKDSRSWGEYWDRFVEGQNKGTGAAVTLFKESDSLQKRRKENDDQLKLDQQAIIAGEMNASDLRIKNLTRQAALAKAVTSVEKTNLEEKFALEDEERNRAQAAKFAETIEDEKRREQVQRQIDEQSAKERAAILENSNVKRAIAQREQAETIRQFQATATRQGLERFGPNANDQNTLLLRNIYGALQGLQVLSRRF